MRIAQVAAAEALFASPGEGAFSMRMALIGIFLAAAMASPLAAQVEDVAVRGGDDGKSREARSEERAERAAARESRRETREAEPRPEPRRQEERRAERVGRTGDRVDRTDEHGDRTQRPVSRREGLARTIDRVFGDRRDHRRGEHREAHRDYRRDHDALHRGDPTRREHDRFHRQVNRDHNRLHQRWDHNWRRDSRYDWERYRYSNRSIFSLGRYYSPLSGHRYSRFSIGVRLGSPFYSHRYRINDPWRYRLPHASAGTQWVRYYDDVLLVDLFTGEVVDVIYNFFW
jgi:Ni/Co efflux regulator RcnB